MLKIVGETRSPCFTPLFVPTGHPKNFTAFGTYDMGSKRATEQVHDDIQTLGKYPIRVRVRVRVGVRIRVRVRVRFQLQMEQPHELIIIIN